MHTYIHIYILYTHIHIIIIIIPIKQPLCPVVGRRPQHVVSKLPCLVVSSAISCLSSICPGRFSTAWLVSLDVFSCHNLWSPSDDTRGPSVVFEAVDMPCPGPFHFSHSVDYIYEFCSLPDPDVGPSIYVMLSIPLSILVCAAASLFCACLVNVHVTLQAGFHGLPFHAGPCGLEGDTEIGVPSLGSCVSTLKGSTCPAT